jgi:hypothetical protein
VLLHTLLCLLPIVALSLPLLARRYPGERALIALRVTEKARFQRPRSSAPPRRRVLTTIARGSRLIGASLAVRPPPALYAAS